MSSKNKKRNKRAAHNKQVAQGAAQKAKAALAGTNKPPQAPPSSGVVMRLDHLAAKRTKPEVSNTKESWWGKLRDRFKKTNGQ